MRRLLLIAAVSALAVAKPETYREKEDFQFSRSSSDDGTKSGFYGAQRGNMGGNYERAHNMDGLAQHQMSTAVRQVEGELGDTSDVNHGRVFTAGSTRGVYGQGNYNLENLSGRNFQESSASADSLSHSSFTNAHSGYGSRSSAQKTAGFGGSYDAYKSRNSGYKSATSDLEAQNQEALENLQYGRNTAGGSAYSQSEYDERSAYNQAHSNKMSSQNTYGGTKSRVPVRVVLRPVSSVNVPVTAEAYDNTHRSSAFDQNYINSDAEVLSNTRNVYRVPENSNGAKHYESQYKYQKEWEKHGTIPNATPLVIPGSHVPVPHNSELYEESAGLEKSVNHEYQLSDIESQKKIDYINSASNHQSQYQSGYKGLRSKTIGANSNYGAYNNLGASADLINSRNMDDTATPKSYQSSYSYKKSWERQGDPYVITPVGGNTESQRLTAANSRAGYGSHQYGTHSAQSKYSHIEGEECDCDEQGNVRVTRSINDQDIGQQTQQVQSSDFEELGQRPLSQNLEDFGQGPQNSWQQVGYFQNQNSKPNKIEDLRQHTQQNSNAFQELTQQSQSQDLEDLSQQVQSNGWDSSNLGQQTQNGWYAEDLFKKPNDKVGYSGGQAPNRLHAGDLFKPEEQRRNGNVNNFGNLNSQIQHTEDIGDSSNIVQHTQNVWLAEDKSENSAIVKPYNRNLHKQTGDLEQQTQNAWYGEEAGQHNENHWKPSETGQTTDKSIRTFGNPSLTPTNQRKPAFNTENLFKPLWEQPEQNSNGFSDWSKFDDIYNGMGKIDTKNFKNEGKLHSTGTDEESYQHSSRNWGNTYGESSRRVQSRHEVQYQFINHQSTEFNSVGYTTESNKNLYPWDLTTKQQPIGTSVFDHTTKINTDIYSLDNNNKVNPTTLNLSHGRGDIETTDAYQAFLGAQSKPKPLTPKTSIVLNKPYKTPAEIEALSLTKDNKESAADQNIYANTNSNDSVQTRHGLSFQSTTQKVNSIAGNRQHQSQGQIEDLGQQVQAGWSTNDNVQQSEDYGQQVVQTNWNANNNFHQSQHQTGNIQTNWNSNKPTIQSQAQTQTDSKFHQTEELEQQSQTGWNSENLQQSAELGQQVQSGWNTNEKLTQSDLQRPDDFYSEHHQLPKAQVENVKVESQTISAPPEITTKPPGFWKNVGGKVSAWFGG